MIEPFIYKDGDNLNPKPDAISESDAEDLIAKACGASFMLWEEKALLFYDGIYRVNENWGYDVKFLLNKYEVTLDKPFKGVVAVLYALDNLWLKRFLHNNHVFTLKLLEKRKPTTVEPYLSEGSAVTALKPDPIPVQEIEERFAEVFNRLTENTLDWADKITLISRGQYRVGGWLFDFKPFLKKFRVTAPTVLCSASGNYYAPNKEALYRYLGVLVTFKVVEVTDE